MIARLLDLFRKRALNCQEVRAASSDYIDGDAGARLSALIESHIAVCPACAAFVRTLRATIELLSAAPAAELPAGFSERIQSRIRREGGA